MKFAELLQPEHLAGLYILKQNLLNYERGNIKKEGKGKPVGESGIGAPSKGNGKKDSQRRIGKRRIEHARKNEKQ